MQETPMLAKRMAKNQLTLPKAAVEAVGSPDYFEVTAEQGRLVLTPVRIGRADAVRTKLAELGIDEAAITAAIGWARQRS